MNRYGGKISSEWFFSKALQILDEAPEVYAAADRLMEAADWVIWRLTGVETRNACTAGYKAMYQGRAIPSPRLFRGARTPNSPTSWRQECHATLIAAGRQGR